MKNLPTALLLILGLIGVARAESPFHLEKVKGAFEQMRSTPGFDTAKPLQWGFIFTSISQAPLDKIQVQLKKQGYRVTGMHKDEEGTFWLELAKTEVHTPESLHRRNQELFKFSKGFPGANYDGWDVTRQK